MSQPFPSSSSPNWYPLSALELISGLIDDMLTSLEKPHRNLKAAQTKPQLLTHEMVQRAIQVYSQELSSLSCYREQLFRWKQANPTLEQLAEINRLGGQVDEIDQTLASILMLANDIKFKNILNTLSKGKVELGLKMLAEKLEPFE